jgi:hypothetical protein
MYEEYFIRIEKIIPPSLQTIMLKYEVRRVKGENIQFKILLPTSDFVNFNALGMAVGPERIMG